MVASTIQRASRSNTSDIVGRFSGSSSISWRDIPSSVSRSMNGRHLRHRSSSVFPQDHRSRCSDLASNDLRCNVPGNTHNAPELVFDTIDAHGPVEVNDRRTAAIDKDQHVFRLQMCATPFWCMKVDRFEQLFSYEPQVRIMVVQVGKPASHRH